MAIILPYNSRVGVNLVQQSQQMLEEVKHLTSSTTKYRLQAHKHRRQNVFNEGDGYGTHNKARLPVESRSDLYDRKFGPVRIQKKLSDNARIGPSSSWSIFFHFQC